MQLAWVQMQFKISLHKGVERSKNEKYKNIMKKKKEISIDELCEGLPDAFPDFMKYCRGLGFTQAPDFGYI